MASGIINLNNSAQTSGGGYLMGKVEWSGTGNAATNQSPVTAKLYVKKASSTGTITVPTNGHWDCSLTIGGSNVSQSVSASIGADWVLLLTLSVPVTHNSDGSKSITISASAYGPSGTSYSGLQTVGSGTAVLDSIPRASTASIGSFTMGTEGTITINRASASFTHTLTYKFGSASGTIASKTSATSVPWKPPLDLANQIPNATSGTGTITLTTYSGSTKIGSKTYNVTLSVPSSVVPSISDVAVSEAVSGLAAKFGAYVQNKSRMAVSITAAGAYGSTIQSYATTIQSRAYSGASFTSAVLTASGTINFTVKVTDSRGRTASTLLSVNVTAYSPPQITRLNAWRIDTSGNEADDGERLALQLAYSVASVGGKNDRILTIQYRQGSTGTLTTISSGTAETSYSGTVNYTDAPELSVDHTYTIQVTLYDYFTSISYTVEIPTATYILDVLDTKDGAAAGKAAEERDLFDVGWNLRARKDLTVDGSATVGGFPVMRCKLLLTRSGGWSSGASISIPELADCDAALVLYGANTAWSTYPLKSTIIPVGKIGVLDCIVNMKTAAYPVVIQRQLTIGSDGTVTSGEVWLKSTNSNAAAEDSTNYPYACSPYKIYGLKLS